jgi:flagellar basal-body rod protein FlgG
MVGTGVKVVGTQKAFTQGNLTITDNATDVAIQGRGFFQVLLPDGTTAYTRNGAFSLDNTGQLVTAGNGYVIQPATTIPQDAQSLTIGADGTISVQLPGQAAPTVLGNLQLVDFVNPIGLQPVGENLFKETASSGAPVTGTPGLAGFGSLVNGALESSNVSVVEELVSLIETQRTYEMNAKVISAVDDMLQFVNQTL